MMASFHEHPPDVLSTLVILTPRQLAFTTKCCYIVFIDCAFVWPLTRVVLDNIQIGRIAADHLLERGFRNLAYYKCTDYQDVREREADFAEVLEKNDLRYKRLNWFGAARRNKQTNPHEWLKRRLLALPKPVGILAQSDHHLLG